MQTRGSIPEIIRNDGRLYEGDLIAYFKIIFMHARNLQLPYHNFRHIFHVLWLCHRACQFYREELTSRQMRNLLIAVLFHDFDHSGRLGDDDLNIERAIRSFNRYVLPDDKEFLSEIAELIRVTEFPYKTPTDQLSLPQQIIRDADLSQSLSVAWVQQVIFGLAAEWGKKPAEVFKMQGPFLLNLKFCTAWAQQEFPKNDITGKIKEAEEFLELLGEEMPQPVHS